MALTVELRRLMEEHGLSMRSLARQIPVDVSHLSRILRGERTTTMQLVQRCEDILHAPGILQAAFLADADPARRPPETLNRREWHDRVWNIAPPVLRFTGREAALAALTDQLATPETPDGKARTGIISGMPGMGKTQLARAFADLHRPRYGIGWWVTAETALEARSGLSELAVRLGATSSWSADETLAYLFEVLAERKGWLIVFDNAPGPAQVAELLPRRGGTQGHILITSRSPSWQTLGGRVALDALSVDEATTVLTNAGSGEIDVARNLAEELGRLPLALAQAAAYTSETGISLTEYLSLFHREQSRLLELGNTSAYPGNITAAITLSTGRLAETDPLAHRALEVCALWAGDVLPIRSIVSALPADGAHDDVACLHAVGTLRQSGLVTPDTGGDVRLHRLSRLVVAERVNDLSDRLADAVHALSELFPSTPSEPASWHECARLTQHATAVLEHALRVGVVSEPLALLFTRVGRYLLCTGLDFAAARHLHEQALQQRRALHPGDHPETARALVHLAVDLNELGDPEEARCLHETALAMRRRLYTEDHPDTAHSLDNLGNVLHRLGDQTAAREHHAQGLAMRRRLYSEDHPNTAYSLNNLAADLRALGEVTEARHLDVEALDMRVRLDLGDHPDVAHSLSNLAADLLAMDDRVSAARLEEQSLQMRLRLYPAGHPQTTACRSRLARLRLPHPRHRSRGPSAPEESSSAPSTDPRSGESTKP